VACSRGDAASAEVLTLALTLNLALTVGARLRIPYPNLHLEPQPP
jgi:hypothetical protein